MLDFNERIKRQDDFFQKKTPNSFLFGFKSSTENDEYSSSWLNDAVKRYYEDNDGRLPDRDTCRKIAEEYVLRIRSLISERGYKDDDFVPTLNIHTDSGCKVAGLANVKPDYLNRMFWSEPNLTLEQISDLHFNPDNEWIQTLLNIYEKLVDMCEGDYLSMPYTHRSPLDITNALRGSGLFLDFYDEPEKVKKAIDKAVDFELMIQDLIYAEVPYDGSCRTGIHGIALPPKAVWVNGDPADMISRPMMLEFEQPYTGRLFTSTGGGYFHHHTLGIYQVDQVARTPGIYTQEFDKDFNVPTLFEVIGSDEEMHRKIIEASLLTPIQIFDVDPHTIDEFLPMLRGGCFSLLINDDDPAVDYKGIAAKIRNFAVNKI